ncbi:hypothetical protein DFP72DRAFT_1082887 [Ephemerocybe angulata]|uniref:Uncharacterized protein n=1 Tax=Ephemerocybe angulata TaxID=980116 RepID=A0A8H6LTC8_9AGAR|nr:hypothetical protein DFP72DRAFT_1082887 [Tulosesus angulatus]
MGRRAKYLTLEAKKEAHRVQRRELKRRPSTAHARQEENRRYYYKKKPPPIVPGEVVRHASLPLSWTDWRSIFVRFLQGEDMLVLDEVELELEDIVSLVGYPPYPARLTNLECFDNIWGPISAALHGRMTWEYVGEINEKITSRSRTPDVDLRIELWAEYAELLERRQILIHPYLS